MQTCFEPSVSAVPPARFGSCQMILMSIVIVLGVIWITTSLNSHPCQKHYISKPAPPVQYVQEQYYGDAEPMTREVPITGAVVEPRPTQSMAGAAPLDDSTYDVSPETKEFYEQFKPVTLEQTMPAGWREKGQLAANDSPDEFSRYAITPNQMKKSEKMRTVLRLSENSRDGLSRTLGQRSLLREYVTPLGPNPIGSTAFPWNDSSVRHAYIASAMGRFPEVSQSC